MLWLVTLWLFGLLASFPLRPRSIIFTFPTHNLRIVCPLTTCKLHEHLLLLVNSKLVITISLGHLFAIHLVYVLSCIHLSLLPRIARVRPDHRLLTMDLGLGNSILLLLLLLQLLSTQLVMSRIAMRRLLVGVVLLGTKEDVWTVLVLFVRHFVLRFFVSLTLLRAVLEFWLLAVVVDLGGCIVSGAAGMLSLGWFVRWIISLCDLLAILRIGLGLKHMLLHCKLILLLYRPCMMPHQSWLLLRLILQLLLKLHQKHLFLMLLLLLQMLLRCGRSLRTRRLHLLFLGFLPRHRSHRWALLGWTLLRSKLFSWIMLHAPVLVFVHCTP